MFERYTDDARAVVRRAADLAFRLGHRYIGTEHLLLAVAGASGPAGDVLREQGITPERVKDQIVRQVGIGAGAGLFAGLDEKALAAIGIDLDEVRARIEASFSDEALYRAAQSVYAQQRRRARRPGWLARHGWPARYNRLVVLGWLPWVKRGEIWGKGEVGWLDRATRRGAGWRKSGAGWPGTVDAAGRWQPPDRSRLPLTPRAKQVIEHSFRESLALRDAHIGVQHLALALVDSDKGLVPPILTALHARRKVLRATILDRYRQAS